MKRFCKIQTSWESIQSLAYFGVKPPKGNGANLGVHGWVDDDSIKQAIASGQRDNLRVRHTHLTNRAVRIATMIEQIHIGARFPRLHLHCHGNGSTLYKVTLRDGHHRLRAYEFIQAQISIGFNCNNGNRPLDAIRFKITGKRRLVRTLRAMLEV